MLGPREVESESEDDKSVDEIKTFLNRPSHEFELKGPLATAQAVTRHRAAKGKQLFAFDVV